MIFDGVGFAKKIEKKLKRDGDLIGKRLIIFRADETDGESVYIRLKKEMGERLGVEVEVIKGVPTPVVIQDYGKASGILVQLPITGVSETERDEILSLIPLEKDVDGLNPNGSKFLPAVVVAVEKILANVKGRTLDMEWEERFRERLKDDLDMPGAVALVWEMMKNKKLTDSEKLGLIEKWDKVLGLRLRASKSQVSDKMEKLVKERDKLRQEKKWEEADKLREKIEKLGYALEDTNEKTKVTVR